MEQTPVVREIDGQLVLDDPAALAAIRVISKANCKNIFNAQVERIDYFSKRLDESGKSPLDYVIIIVNVDDVNGKEMAIIHFTTPSIKVGYKLTLNYKCST